MSVRWLFAAVSSIVLAIQTSANPLPTDATASTSNTTAERASAAPVIKVLVGSMAEACTNSQYTKIKQAFVDAKDFSSYAGVIGEEFTGVEKSEAVTTWLGSGLSHSAWEAYVSKRFVNPNGAFANPPASTTKLEDDGAVYIYCQNDASPCTSDDFAITRNIHDNPPADYNEIALCTRFFNGRTIKQEEDLYNQNKAAGKSVNFQTLENAGLTLIHEAQHSLPILQSTTFSDNLKDFATSPGACAGLSTTKKRTNAENFAVLAFLAVADSGRFNGPT